MVLMIEFLNNLRVFPVILSNMMCIMGEGNACTVPMAREASFKTKTMLIMQINKGLKRKQSTYLTSLKGNEGPLLFETVVPEEITQVLEEY